MDCKCRLSKDSKPSKKSDDKEWLNEGMEEWDKAEEWVRNGGNPYKLRDKYAVNKLNMEYFVNISKEAGHIK